MARSSRTQIIIGAMVMMALFLGAVFFASRQTFREQYTLLERQSQIAAQAALVTATSAPADGAAIERAIGELPVPADGVIVVMDLRARRIIASRAPAALRPSMAFDAVPADGPNEDADGVGRAYGSVSDASGQWKVVVGLPRRMVWETTLPVYRRNVINAGWWYVLSVGGLVWIITRWLRSVKELEKISSRVAAGDLSTPPLLPMASSELEQMQVSMVQMITRVRELQRQLVRQERLAAIGVLVSGVAHEINNPLQAILGFSQVLSSRSDMPAEARADLDVIQRESERASTIIRNLSRFTRQQPAGPAPVRLTDIVTWLAELWQRRFEESGIEFEVVDRSTRIAHAVATEIQQVALNFLANAEYAVLNNPAPGAARRIVIRTSDTPGGCVRLEVDDSGPGVSHDHEPNLFQPFFTTKPVGEGTGLGLSVSYGIVHSHGGTIGHDRGSLGGARFYFELPAEPAAPRT